MLKAPELDSLIRICDRNDFNPKSYDKKTNEKIKNLFKLLDKIEPIDDDELRVIYFSVERGTIKNFGNYKELKRDGEVSSYQDFKEWYQDSYPEKIYWYRMATRKYEDYYGISINDKMVINADLKLEDSPFEIINYHELLDFLIAKIKEIIQMLKDGTYNDYVNKNLSCKRRYGVIKRSDYWNLFPQKREELLEEISENEMEYFIQNASDKVSKRIENMTSGKYFWCVKLALEANGYDVNNLTDKEVYLKYADGRDEGLRDLKEDSSKEFDDWYKNDKRFGGHPYEIIRGHSFARVNLGIFRDENGYLLHLDGTRILRKIEIAKMFNILTKNNIPVSIFSSSYIKDAFKGEDYLGIVPDYDFLIYCDSAFKKYKPHEFMHLPKSKEVFKYIKWEPLEQLKLKNTN